MLQSLAAAAWHSVEVDATLAGITAPVVCGGILSDTEYFEAGVVEVTFGPTYKSFASTRICVTLLFDTLVENKNMQREIFTMRIGAHAERDYS